MPDDVADPSMNTEAFRAFQEQPPEPAKPSRTPLIIGGAVLAVIVIAVILLVAL